MLSAMTLIGSLAVGHALTDGQPQQQLSPTTLPPADAVLSETFTALTSVRELGDGRVLLSDPRERRLVVADFARQHVGQLGRRGQGPGEFSNAAPFHALSADSSVVADVNRWLFFHGTSIVATRTANDAEVRTVPFPYGFDSRGFVLTTHSPPLDPTGRRLNAADSTQLVLVARSTARPDTIARLRPSPLDANRPPGGLAVYEQAVLAPDGWVAIVRLEPYRVDWRSPAGQWLPGAPLPVPIERMDGANRRLYEGEPRPGQQRVPVRWPEYLPPFTIGWRPMATFDGKLVIRRAKSVRNPGTRYDVIDRRGHLVRQLLLPPNERILGFGRESVYVVVKDDVDLETVRRHPWS
jgi:hypothetical protein